MNKEEEKLLSMVSAWIKGKQIGTIYIARDEGVYNLSCILMESITIV